MHVHVLKPNSSFRYYFPTQLHANIVLTLCYLGRQLHLATTSKQLSMIEVLQQHCGGNTLLLYRRKLKPRGMVTICLRSHTCTHNS